MTIVESTEYCKVLQGQWCRLPEHALCHRCLQLNAQSTVSSSPSSASHRRLMWPKWLARDAQAKLALIVEQCLSIHLSICPSVCLSATAWVTRMYAALRVASHVDYRLVNIISTQESRCCCKATARCNDNSSPVSQTDGRTKIISSTDRHYTIP